MCRVGAQNCRDAVCVTARGTQAVWSLQGAHRLSRLQLLVRLAPVFQGDESEAILQSDHVFHVVLAIHGDDVVARLRALGIADVAEDLVERVAHLRTSFSGLLKVNAVLLWAGKGPLSDSNRRPTLLQPMHSGVDIIGSIQGFRQRLEQTHPPMVLRIQSSQCFG